MPRLISTLATIMSITRKGMKIRKPIWNAVFSSLVTKAGTSTRKRHVLALDVGRQLGQLGEQHHVGLARLLEHELAHRHLAALERLVEGDLVGGEGLVGLVVDLVQRRAHHEEGQEQAQADDHLVGRRGLRAQRLAQQATAR